MTTNKEQLLKLTHKELCSLFCSALLCARNSFLGGAAEALSKALRYSLKLTITGAKGIEYQTVIEICNLLGIKYKEVEYTVIIKKNFVNWSKESTDDSYRLWIPELNYRNSDLGILIAFYLYYHLAKLRTHNPDFKMPMIDILYPLLLWSKYLILNKLGLSNRILRDLLNTENQSALQLHVSETVNDISEDVRHVHGRIFKLSESALLYLGFTKDYQLYQTLNEKKLTNYKSINRKSRKMINAMSLGSGNYSMPKFPYSLKRNVFKVNQLPIIFENLYILDIYKIGDQIKNCLIDRINGISEEEICAKLEFKSFDDYQKWLKKAYINIEPDENNNVYEKWLEACEMIGLTPEIPENTTIMNRQQSTIAGKDSKATLHEPRLRFSPDFRSVYIFGKGTNSLTEKQSEVIKMLYGAYQNKTPEIAQSYIIQMVYGEVIEKRLKKQFNNNELWEELIEEGNRRGLVRLKL